MGIRREQGFTVIEVVLFLSITSLMIVTMIVGAGASLSAQRYRDSVESFRSLVQDQYTSLSSIQNDRTDNWSCDGNANTVENNGTIRSRGQSSCIIAGSYMRIESNAVSIYTVLARHNGGNTANDISAMRTDYAYDVANTETREETLEWGARIAWAPAGNPDGVASVGTPRAPRNLGILFLRSPKTGIIYTFTSNSIPAKNSITPSTFSNMIRSGNVIPGQAGRMVCIDSAGVGSVIGGNLGVYIAPFAAGASAVKFHTNEDPDGLKC